jgi:hypothetical protein
LHYNVHYVNQKKFQTQPIDICTNVFNMYGRPLWEANTNAQFILYPYDIATYYISYFTKVDKYVPCEIRYIILKCKYEETKTYEWIKKLGNALFNVQ